MKASQTARKHPRLLNSKWPRVVTAGSVKVKIYRISPKEGTPFYQIADYSLGRRRLRSVASETSALDQARQLAAKMARGEVGAAQLTHQQAASYARAIDSLETTGDPIELAAARYAEAVSQLGGQSSLLLHAVRDYVRRHPTRLSEKSVTEVVGELLEVKKTRGSSERYLQDLGSRLKRFAGAFQTPISNVVRADIQSWLDSLPVGPQSYRNYRRVLHTFFEFSLARQYVFDNPVEGIEQPLVRQGDKAIYTPAEMRGLIKASTEDFLPFLAIGGFAGLRSNEIERLQWEDIRDGFITISAGKAKTGSRRIVPIQENLANLILPHARKIGKVWPGNHNKLSNTLKKVASKAGLKWKPNALRHSYASYRLALIKNEAQVAHELGNSAAIVHRHYKELVNQQSASDWFSISSST